MTLDRTLDRSLDRTLDSDCLIKISPIPVNQPRKSKHIKKLELVRRKADPSSSTKQS